MDESLLALEDTHALWEPEVRGLKLWPLIRTKVLLSKYAQERGYQDLSERNQINKYLSPEQWMRYARSLIFFMSRPSPIYSSLFFTNNLVRYPHQDNRQSFDRLHGEYFKYLAASLVFESRQSPKKNLPDKDLQDRLLSQDLIWLVAYGASRSVQLDEGERETVREFVHDLVNLYGVNADSEGLTQRIMLQIRMYPSLRSILTSKINPWLENKIAFIQIASYLGRQGLVTKILHELDYKVIEVQHGIIHPKHSAYNYPDEVISSSTHPARVYLPDYLLTYGSKWANYLRSPSEPYPIGAPYLSEIVDRLKSSPKAGADDILVISQWTAVNRLIKIAMILAKAFPDRKIIYKLHPAEIGAVDEFKSRLSEPNIEVSSTGNVYELLAATPIVVGFNSTVLVEATAFPDTRIFFLDQEIIPSEVGSNFSNSDELISMISDPEKGIPRSLPSEFWEPDWRRRIPDFISQLGLL